MEVCRAMEIELFKQLVEPPVQAAGFLKRGGIDKIIVAPLHWNIVRGQPVHIHKTHALGIVFCHLIDGEAVALMGKKCLFPFRLMVQAVLHQRIKFRAFLPFLPADGIHGIWLLRVKILPVKQHLGAAAVHHRIHRQVFFVKLHRPLFGDGQHIPVPVAALFQIIQGDHGVRHGVFVQGLLRGIRQHGTFRGRIVCLSRLHLHLLVVCFL